MALEPKTKKIIIAAVVLIVVIALVWFFFLRGASNKFASAASLKKIKAGGYGTYNDTVPTDQYNKFWGALNTAFGEPNTRETSGWTREELARGWLKGFNIAMNDTNVSTFATDIGNYLKMTDAKPHWATGFTAGMFLN